MRDGGKEGNRDPNTLDDNKEGVGGTAFPEAECTIELYAESSLQTTELETIIVRTDGYGEDLDGYGEGLDWLRSERSRHHAVLCRKMQRRDNP